MEESSKSKESSKTGHHNSIPRFELVAATIASDFYQNYHPEAGEDFEKVTFYNPFILSCVIINIILRKSPLHLATKIKKYLNS